MKSANIVDLTNRGWQALRIKVRMNEKCLPLFCEFDR